MVLLILQHKSEELGKRSFALELLHLAPIVAWGGPFPPFGWVFFFSRVGVSSCSCFIRAISFRTRSHSECCGAGSGFGRCSLYVVTRIPNKTCFIQNFIMTGSCFSFFSLSVTVLMLSPPSLLVVVFTPHHQRRGGASLKKFTLLSG